MKLEFDVVVIGAGIIGQSMALGLGIQGFKVALVDNAPSPDIDEVLEADVFSNRVSAISFSSQQLFERLGVWQIIERKQEYLDMQVSEQDGFGNIHFSKQELLELLPSSESGSTPCLGHIIENNQINIALYKKIKEFKNVSCYYSSTISEITNDERFGYISFTQNNTLKNNSSNTPTTVSSRLIIGADGANSKVREQVGLKYHFNDYEHTAIVCNVQTQHPHNNLAKQVFTPYGPLAFLPLAHQHQCSIVYSQSSERALELNAMSDVEFAKLLQVTIDNYYGNCTLVTPRASFPLRMRYARNWIAPHIALMGDAAHTIHPLAGQGANLGLGDVNALLKLIEQEPDKIGSVHQLRKYERCRKSEALKVIATMQGFKELFDGSNPIKKLIRNSGLAIANKASPIKTFFIKQAMG